jgi:hypothetical protein
MYHLPHPLPKTNVKRTKHMFAGIYIPGKVQSGDGLTNQLSTLENTTVRRSEELNCET